MSSYKDRRITRSLGIKQGIYDSLDANGKGALTNLVYYGSYYASGAERKERAKRIIANSRERQGLPTGEENKQPTTVKGVLAAMRKEPRYMKGIELMRQREADYDDPLTMELAGIASDPDARQHFDAALDRIWAEATPPKSTREVVIGAGFHAAVYASVRVAMGKPRPLVLEAERVGGAFAVSKGPSFYLNSRNRPGNLGIPGRGEALNVIPGGPVQPAHLSGDEYQRNSDLAFAIRCALAMNARVCTGRRIKTVERGYNTVGAYLYDNDGLSRTQRVYGNGALTRYTTRLIYATGLGGEARPASKSDRILTFSQFMARMDEPFPLRGLGRVAVVGSGDSGKTAIEALVGQGPSQGMSTVALDHVDRIDWYGVPETCINKERWNGTARSRYAGIARYLPNGTRADRRNPPRVRPYETRIQQVSGSYEGVRLNGLLYDHVIWCTGFNTEEQFNIGDYVGVENRYVASKLTTCQYAIGPAARLPMDQYETEALPSNLPENQVALFRYAERTATFAARVDAYENGTL